MATSVGREEAALQRCDEQIRACDRQRRREWRYYATAQIVAFSGSGITPVLLLWSDLSNVLKAVPAAMAALAAGLAGIFHWVDNSARLAYTADALRSERFKYMAQATADYAAPLTEEQAYQNFVARMEALLIAEVSDWRATIRRTPKDSG